MPNKTAQAPSPGNIGKSVHSQPVHTLAPKRFGTRVAVGHGVRVVVQSVQGVRTVTRLPGQVGGPSIKVTVRITNGSSGAIDISNVNVNANDSAGAPASPITAAPARPFKASLTHGKSAAGIYVFSMAVNRRDPVTIAVNYAAGTSVALFTGNVK